MFLLFQTWVPKTQVADNPIANFYSEKLYLAPNLTWTTDPDQALQFDTQEDALSCISWLANKRQWQIEEYSPPTPQLEPKEGDQHGKKKAHRKSN